MNGPVRNFGKPLVLSMRAEQFVTVQTLMIMVLGLFAFVFDTVGGVLFAKFLNLFSKNKINPMIGAAGISAFPMSARVIEKMGVAEDSTNHLLMHAIGANVSTVERPLRLHVYPDREIPADLFKKADELASVKTALASVPAGTPTDDWEAFAKATRLKAGVLKKIRPYITEKDPTAQPIEGEADVDLRDTENVPFTYEGGIEAFMQNEVLPYSPDAFIDTKKTQIGYEISFTKFFYKPVELREMNDILATLSELEKEADGVLAEIMGGIS